ncbi:MAG TPA: sialate O-acetylesterase [Polyangiaceae bacterium]|nr:sialate O-acetylesterase [Polyangiaceae bacterium]
MRGASSDPTFHLYLLLGQSNMAGAPLPEARDLVRNPRVHVLSYADCPEQDRTYGRWAVALPPLHGCGAGLGPGDSFGKVLADAYPDARIGLIPCAINGVDIDFYRKGVVSARRSEFVIPPDDHWSGAYEWVVERARLAQRSGVIRGILLHQGESDTCDPAWPGKIKEIVHDLRTDLALGTVPLVVGELLHGGVCAEHNALVNGLPRLVPNTYVASASGLGGMDEHHFDLDAQRELGRRYGARMLEALAS